MTTGRMELEGELPEFVYVLASGPPEHRTHKLYAKPGSAKQVKTAERKYLKNPKIYKLQVMVMEQL